MRARARCIESDGSIETETKIGLYLQCSSCNTAQSNCFLHSENTVHILKRILQLTQRFDKNENRNAIVERFYIHAIAHLYQLSLTRYNITNGNYFFYFVLLHPKVDEIIVQRNYFISFFGRHHVNWLCAH